MKIKLTEHQFRRIILEQNNIIDNPITTLYHGTSNYQGLSLGTLKMKRDESMYLSSDSKTGSLDEKCHGIYLTQTPPSGERGYGNPRMYALWKWADYVRISIIGGKRIDDAFTQPHPIIYEVKLKDDVKLSKDTDPCVTAEELNNVSGTHYGVDGFQGRVSGGGNETIIWNDNVIESISKISEGQFEFFEGGAYKIRWKENTFFTTTRIMKIAKGHYEDIGKMVWS